MYIIYIYAVYENHENGFVPQRKQRIWREKWHPPWQSLGQQVAFIASHISPVLLLVQNGSPNKLSVPGFTSKCSKAIHASLLKTESRP